MKQVEVKLSLPVVEPLLEFVEPLFHQLEKDELPQVGLDGVDPEMLDFWKSGLLGSQRSDARHLRALFDSEFYRSGRVVVSEDQTEPVLRACSAMRLKLRTGPLAGIPDDRLEAGDLELEKLGQQHGLAFAAYLLFATLQEIVIQHLAE